MTKTINKQSTLLTFKISAFNKTSINKTTSRKTNNKQIAGRLPKTDDGTFWVSCSAVKFTLTMQGLLKPSTQRRLLRQA
jgi:hypothetical protein